MITPFRLVKFYLYKDFERQNSVQALVLQVLNGYFNTIWLLDLAIGRFIPPEGLDDDTL